MRVAKTLLLKIWKSWLLPEWLKDFILYCMNKKYIVGVLALVTDGSGRVLLFKHSYFAQAPWGIPGGAAKREDLEEAVRREIGEESQYSIKVDHNVGVAQWNRRRIDFLFACSIDGGQFRRCEEVVDYDYFYLDQLPEMRPHHRAILDEIVRKTASPSKLDASISGLFISLSRWRKEHHAPPYSIGSRE
jgi:8-oxo-dGTP pyrophosphatase MutT (NUDIX family)